MYERGWGVSVNRTKAVEYYKRAAAMGNAKAKENLKHLEKP